MEWVLEHLSLYPGPWAFALLVACGLGLPPWSEELVTVGVGHFVAQGHVSFPVALIWCWGGLLAGDSVVFWLGEHLGERVYSWPILGRHLGPKRRFRFNRFMMRHGTKAVFAARFVPGLRMIAYFVAGNLRMPFWKFFLLDSVGAALYAPAGVFLGFFFTGNLDLALRWLRRFEIPAALAGVIVIILLFRYGGRRRRQRLDMLLRLRASRRKEQAGPPPSEDGPEPPSPSGPAAGEEPAVRVGAP